MRVRRGQMSYDGIRRLTGYCVASALLAGSILMSPLDGLTAELKITPSIEFRETFSDNVDLATDDEKESAVISEVIPGIEFRSDSARLIGALDAFPIVRHQTAGEDEGLSLGGNLAGFITLEAYEDVAFIDAQASISQQVLDDRAIASTANEEDVYVYRLSPYLRHRFGSLAEGEMRYHFSQIHIQGEEDAASSTTASDSMTHGIDAELVSGDDFSRLHWSMGARASEQNRSDDDDVSRREAEVEIGYAVIRSISVLAGGGYQYFDDGNPANEVDGPTWLVGLHLRPGPRTDLRITYGERDDDLSANVDFTYRISPRTRITAKYSRILETSQERLVRTLSGIDLAEDSDILIDEDTDFAFDPNPDALSINDETTRVESIRFGLNGTRGRNGFGITTAFIREEIEPSGETEDKIRASAGWSRRLNPHLDLNVFGTYERSEFDDGQIDDEYFATIGSRYRLSESVEVGTTYGFRLQNSTDASSEFKEHSVLLSVKKTF